MFVTCKLVSLASDEEEEGFYDRVYWGQYYKTILIHNVQETNKFHSKLVFLVVVSYSRCLGLHIGLLWNLYIINLQCFKAQTTGVNVMVITLLLVNNTPEK